MKILKFINFLISKIKRGNLSKSLSICNKKEEVVVLTAEIQSEK